MSEVFAGSKDDVGRSAIDYFTWGHIAMGVAIFLLLSLINTIPSYIDNALVYIIPYILMLFISFLIGVVWEILENTLFVGIGIKFEGRRDSFVNALWDVIFVCIGALIIWIIKGLMVNLIGPHLIPAFYIVGIVIFVVSVLGFVIGRAITK
ncbi:MAG: hypothetical protein GF353_06145 [Candidatus Lokiarchaeota archaeon]|nr:hypothetical protein [Candidatus Lokiarchaeota archaeon]